MTDRPQPKPRVVRAKEPVALIIDDDTSLRDALSSLFRSVGLQVQLFGSATETPSKHSFCGCKPLPDK
jgi:FixJ family two-component response regulator